MGNDKNIRLDILPGAQRRLWKELGGTPAEFVLYGGTAIALRLGHRRSIDFDFFAFAAFDPYRLRTAIPYLRGATVLQEEPNTLTCRVERGGAILVSFFGLPNLRAVAPAEQLEKPRIKLGSLIDLAGMKMAVMPQRVQLRDYLDIHALLTKADINLPQALAAASFIYGKQFNPFIALKALSYFGEGHLTELPDRVKSDLYKTVKSVDLTNLPALIESIKKGWK